MDRIYLSAPHIGAAERALVLEAIDSNWVAPIGPALDTFECEVALATDVPFAVGMSSGTAALHIGLRLLGVAAGDEVLVSSFSFVASANAVAYQGATPVFIDADPDTWCISPRLVEAELRERARRGRLPKAAVLVDLYGQCCDYERLLPLFAEYGVAVLEDAAESLGASCGDHRSGSFGDFGVVSFNGNKIITTSGGGMLLCHDQGTAEHARKLATQAREPCDHYEHVELGYNYRLSNILAALGLGQLRSLDAKVQRRQWISQQYRANLATRPGVTFMPMATYGRSNHWLTCAVIDPEVAGVSSEQVRRALEGENIESRPTWKPLHLQPLYASAPGRIDGTSESIFAQGLCLPSGSGMTDEDLARVVTALEKCLG